MSIIKTKHFDPDKDIPDLAGKTFVVTGGSTGIGFGIVAHLLQHNASKIYLLSNKEEHASEAIAELKNWGDIDAIEWQQCDLADLTQTRDVALKLKDEIKQLDALILNAGLGVGNYSETKDGIVNCLSQMYLTEVLLQTLKDTPNSRIVCQSSEFHRMAPSATKFASEKEINRDIGPSNLYARSKLAQILFVRVLLRREVDPPIQLRMLPSRGGIPWINATHPGGVETPQQEQAKEAYGAIGKVGVAMVRPFLTDPVKTGCRSALFAATSPQIVSEGINGQYIVPDREVKSPSKQAQSRKLEEALWELYEEIITDRWEEAGFMGPTSSDEEESEGDEDNSEEEENSSRK